MKMTNNCGNCIVLNKPFVGSYIKNNSHEAHEIINFSVSDKGTRFVYCNPYGQNIKNSKNLDIRYFLLTSPKMQGKFMVEYVLEVTQLHHQSISKREIGTKAPTLISKIKKAENEIDYSLKNLGPGVEKSLKGITYGRVPLTNLFYDKLPNIPVTFIVLKAYRVHGTQPICCKTSGKGSVNTQGRPSPDYNFQRNFGYVTYEKQPNTFAYLTDVINGKNGILSAISAKPLILNNINTAKWPNDLKQRFCDYLNLHKNCNYKKMFFLDD